MGDDEILNLKPLSNTRHLVDTILPTDENKHVKQCIRTIEGKLAKLRP